MTCGEFLETTRKVLPSGGLDIRPRVICADGFSISIQASENHYCTPQTNLEGTEYKAVELGFPSDSDDNILPFAEDFDNPTSTVYPQVPIKLVDELLRKHGGIVGTKKPDGKSSYRWMEAEELYKKLTIQSGDEEKKVQKPKTIEENVDDYWSCRIIDECYTNDYEADHMSADKILEELLSSMKLYKTLNAYKNVDKEFA